MINTHPLFTKKFRSTRSLRHHLTQRRQSLCLLQSKPCHLNLQDPVTDSILLLSHEEKEGSVEEAKEQSPDNPEQVEKTHEDAQNAGVVSLGSSSTEISEKQERKKRVMKRLGLGSSKRRKT